MSDHRTHTDDTDFGAHCLLDSLFGVSESLLEVGEFGVIGGRRGDHLEQA